MLSPRVLATMLAMALPAWLSLAPAVLMLTPAPAAAAPAGGYHVGMRLRAKQSCTVKGYAIKKGVVLTVVAVHKNDQGKVNAIDLSFSGMTITAVDIETVNEKFSPA